MPPSATIGVSCGEPLLEPAHASAWTVRPSIPPATVTSSPVTWPDSSSEARTTTARATSSARATLRSAIVRLRRATNSLLELAARHRRVRPAGRDGVDPAERSDPHDLVLEAEQQPDLDRRFRRRVVGVPGLAEAAGGRADEHEIAVTLPLDDAEEAAGGEEGRGEVRAQRRLPAFERQLPDRLVRARPDARDRRTDVDAAQLPLGRLEQRVDLLLHREVGLQRDSAGLARELLGALCARPVVDRDARALGRERAHAGRADPASAAGDEDALPGQSRLHGLTLSSPSCAST